MTDSDFEKYRTAYYWEIPDGLLLDWLQESGWSRYEKSWEDPCLVEFQPITEPEDSYFLVTGHGSQKCGLREAIKLAYFAMQDERKEERRKEYESLKKEFGGEG